jgi:hypothetical protein
VTVSNQAPERLLSRRDVVVAGAAGLVGVVTGTVGTVVTTYVQERARTGFASTDLDVYPEIRWSFDGSWAFYSSVSIDLSKQPLYAPDSQREELIEYLVKNGCVRASPLMMVLHLSRPGDSPAIVRNIALLGHRRSAPLDGACYFSEGAGGGENAVFATDLDEPNPRFVRSNMADVLDRDTIQKQPDAFSTSTFSVAPHFTESMTLVFHASRFAHEFSLRLQYFVEGRDYAVDISSAGLPFRVTSFAQKSKYRYCVPWYNGIHNLVPCEEL